MKKTLLVLAACAVSAVLPAQITITSADIAPIYTVILRANDTMPSVTPGSAGANQTWNLSAMANHVLDTMTFTTPNFTPYASDYPGAGMAVQSQGSLNAYIIGNLSSTSLQMVGQAGDPFGIGTNAAFHISPHETILNFPSTFGSTYTDTAHGYAKFYLGYDPGIGFVIDTVQIRSIIYKTSNIDAWGSVTTPLGTYNSIRQNVMRFEVDTVDIYALGNWGYDFYSLEDSNRVYSWWANSIGWPVAELTDGQNLGTITRATWIEAQPSQVGIAEHNKALFNVYPNPANQLVYFNGPVSGGEQVRLIDLGGRLVKTAALRADYTGVDVGDLAPGLYFYQVTDQHGNQIERGKIDIAR